MPWCRLCVRTLLTVVADLPTVILEPEVGSLEYRGREAELPVSCLVTDANPAPQLSWIRVGENTVFSTQPTITVGSRNTGQFLCTALNSVGPSLTASLTVQIRGEIECNTPALHSTVIVIKRSRGNSNGPRIA